MVQIIVLMLLIVFISNVKEKFFYCNTVYTSNEDKFSYDE